MLKQVLVLASLDTENLVRCDVSSGGRLGGWAYGLLALGSPVRGFDRASRPLAALGEPQGNLSSLLGKGKRWALRSDVAALKNIPARPLSPTRQVLDPSVDTTASR